MFHSSIAQNNYKLAMLVSLLFILCTSSTASTQADISPSAMSVATTLHGNISFHCSAVSIAPLSGGIDNIQWLLNDTSVESLDLSNVHTDILNAGGITIGVLTITNVPLDLNRTFISCTIAFGSGRVENSDDVLILIQGLLSAVGSLRTTLIYSNVSLTWTAPFSLLNIISTYCVDVVNSTSSLTLHSECGITETEFNYPIPPDAHCHVYTFTVTPVNVVGNGTKIELSFFNENGPKVLTSLRDSYTGDDDCAFSFLLNMSSLVCMAELSFMDLDTWDIITMPGSAELSIEGNMITFDTSHLISNRRYNVTIRANNTAGHVVSWILISTHSIENAKIATQTNTVAISLSYSDDGDCSTSVMGALVNYIHITDDGVVEFSKSLLLSVTKNNHSLGNNYLLSCNLSAGLYMAYIYDIRQDSSGVLYPAFMQEFTIDRTSLDVPISTLFFHLKSCSVSSHLHLVIAECTFSDHSMATGFQMVVQSSVLHKVNRLLISQLQATDYRTSTTVEVDEDGLYMVSIIPLLQQMAKSAIEFREIVEVFDDNFVTTIESVGGHRELETVTVLTTIAVGFGILVIIIMCGIIMVQCHKIRSLKSSTQSVIRSEVDVEQDTAKGVTNSSDDKMYEEIENLVPNSSATPNTNIAMSRSDYQLTLCAAYGVH